MQRVAIINGRPVFSDKRLARVVNSRVEFSDGSWCDVRTGDVVNKGRGSIQIGGSDAPVEDKITKGPELFEANFVEVRNVEADITIEPHQGAGIEVTMTGPASLVNEIRATANRYGLIIEGSPTRGNRGSIVTSVSGIVATGSISINSFGRSSFASVNFGSAPVQVFVKVPVNPTVGISDVDGEVKIGNINGKLSLNLTGSGDVKVGSVTDLTVALQGSGDIDVARVNGTVNLQLRGSGDIEIDDGTMSSLIINLQGSGDIKVGGVATSASITSRGSGDVKVAHVLERPMTREQGSGDIKVRRIG